MSPRTRRLDRLERTILEIVGLGKGRFGWHDVATRLSTRDVPRRPDLFDVLKRLQAEGLLVRIGRDEGSDHWALTARGSAATIDSAAGGDVGRLAAALTDPATVLDAVRTLLDETADAVGDLRRVVAEHPVAAEGVATAALFLSPTEVGALAPELAAHSDVEVRRALFRAWRPLRMEAQGGTELPLSDDELEELLRAGVSDDDPEVRLHATAVVFGAACGSRLVPELLDNLERGDAALRQNTLLALGSGADGRSFEALREVFLGNDPEEAADAIRALAARPDGRGDWRAALDDDRDPVRRAAIFALARVVEGLGEEEVSALEASSRRDVVEAVHAYRERARHADG